MHSFEELSTHFSIGIIYMFKFMYTITCHGHDNTKDPGSLVKLELYFWLNPCQGKHSRKYVKNYQKSTAINWQLFIIDTYSSRQPGKCSGKAFTKLKSSYPNQKILGKLTEEADPSRGCHRSITHLKSFPWFRSPLAFPQKWRHSNPSQYL